MRYGKEKKVSKKQASRDTVRAAPKSAQPATKASDMMPAMEAFGEEEEEEEEEED